ncbi:release factor glutamine methyltransferase [Actinokineospora alba]|uniref:Release factor glutamine methyltransferase n=1 Tax=Actinokineospora alba TaxID=504798 RepID=A0A1H0TUH9_9PSEU|nr:HemK2/MTQ2 family protein methyltransferase [Actinokineospora alba]TDP70728.1 release factor glutamine methyltransferase [Actinokineospora alba]SDJ14683.1 release factor glutamine methyltransferase [Actinokineospora alba]SDP57707.1 release factor glutamine methyltransferase [Actinokineospora alba]
MLLLRPPGVYRPQSDTRLLLDAFEAAAIPPGGTVLDVGTGTGAIAIAAARAGARHVTAADVSLRAVIAARLNARLRRARVFVEHGDALDLALGRRFDLILANPPYVPASTARPRGRARAWDAGHNGRAILDRLCALAPDLLAPNGTLLVVHSGLCDADTTLHQLRGGGLKAAIVARQDEPFGPVMNQRVDLLESRGLIPPGRRHEELVVIRADRVTQPR